MKITAENYLNLQGWMRTELNLSGSELLAYGLIYGFSQEENQWCTCGLQYITDWIGVSNKQRTREVLQRLESKQLIIKVDEYFNGVKFCKYKTNRHTVAEKAIPSMAERATNNKIIDNKTSNSIELESKAKPTAQTFEQRRADFQARLIPYEEKYGREMVVKFYNYWAEKSTKGKERMRWEDEKFFEIGRRLATWYRKEQEYRK